MAQTYEALVQSVRDWANRDATSLPDTIIQQCLRFAADTAYRELMIPPLENIQQIALISEEQLEDVGNFQFPSFVPHAVVRAAASGRNTVELPIPGDLTSFIYLRLPGQYETVQDATTFTTGINSTRAVGETVLNEDGSLRTVGATGVGGFSRSGTVWNEKADVRTFHDLGAEKYDLNHWTRQESNILASGYMQPGDIMELYYYRRLSALNATYAVSPENYRNGLLTFSSTATDTQLFFPTGTLQTAVEADVILDSPTLMPTSMATADNTVAFRFIGESVPNWLREENDKILLFGALHHAFDYLAEEDQSQKYFQKAILAIEELNQEEKTRKASGGNVQMNFNGRGLI